MVRSGRSKWRWSWAVGMLAVVGCSRSSLRQDGPVRRTTDPRCGNGALEADEECDDGNLEADDGCEAACTRTRIGSVVVGASYSCALTEGGVVRCWGLNRHGRAGYGMGICSEPSSACSDTCCIGDDETPASSPGPVDVGGRVLQLASDSHTCALLDGGRVRCWGAGAAGALGYGNTDHIGDDETPAFAGDVDVGGYAVQVVVAGNDSSGHTCVVLDHGGVRCWGYGYTGSLGYGNTDHVGDDEVPATRGDVELGGRVVSLVAGEGFNCALMDTGGVRCWGFGERGRLGYGNTETIGDDEVPASAGELDMGGRVVQLAAGGRHTCAVLDSGSVRCWGFGATGALGYGNADNVGDDETPAQAGDVDLGGRAVRVFAGKRNTCALLDDGGLKCWGQTQGGQIGQPGWGLSCHACTGDQMCCLGDDEAPAAVPVIDVGGRVIDAATGHGHTCAVLDTGSVRCWGTGSQGALGYGDMMVIGDDEPPSTAGDVPLF